jgi:hypothetical protein
MAARTAALNLLGNVYPDRMSAWKPDRRRIAADVANAGQVTVGGCSGVGVGPARVAFRSLANIHRYLSMSRMENSPRP